MRDVLGTIRPRWFTIVLSVDKKLGSIGLLVFVVGANKLMEGRPYWD